MATPKIKITTEQREKLFAGATGLTKENVNRLSDFIETSMSSKLADLAKATRVAEEKKAEAKYRKIAKEAVSRVKKGLVEKIDLCLDQVVETWVKKNRGTINMTIENVANSRVVEGLRSLLDQNYIKVPAARQDVLAQLTEHAANLEKSAIGSRRKAKIAISEAAKMKRRLALEMAARPLPATQREKLIKMGMRIEAKDTKDFVQKVKALREGITGRRSAPTASTKTRSAPTRVTLATESRTRKSGGDDLVSQAVRIAASR